MEHNFVAVAPGISRHTASDGGGHYQIKSQALRELGVPVRLAGQPELLKQAKPGEEDLPAGFFSAPCLVDPNTHLLRPNVEVVYSEVDHDRWRRLFQAIRQGMDGRVVDEAIQGMDWITGLGGADRIPDLRKMSDSIEAISGFKLVPVMGLLPGLPFFNLLANNAFPVTVSLRREEEFAYTSFPDLFHDMIGHAPMFLDKNFCNFAKTLGVLGEKYADRPLLQDMIGQIYWYTVEFGLKSTSDGLRVYGAGIISSVAETVASVEARNTQDGQTITRLPLDIPRVLRSHYEYEKQQVLYFVINNYDQLMNLAKGDVLERHILEHARKLAHAAETGQTWAIPMGTLLPGEQEQVFPPNVWSKDFWARGKNVTGVSASTPQSAAPFLPPPAVAAYHHH